MTARVWAEMGLLALIWGATFLFTEIALEEVGALTAVAYRLSIGAVVLWAMIAALRLPLPRTARFWVSIAVMGFLNNLVPFSLITFGQLSIQSGLAAILNATTGVFGVVTAALFLADERLRAHKAFGALVAFGGVVLTIGPSLLRGFDPTALGQLAAIGAALSYSMAAVWARKRLSGVHPLAAAAGMVTSASLMLIPIALLVDGRPQPLSVTTWAALGYQGVIATAIAFLFYYRILARAGSANLLVVTLLLPPVAILLGAVVLGERLEAHQFAGFLVIALGLVLIDGRVLGRRRPAGSAAQSLE